MTKINESGLARIYQHVMEHDVAMITGWRGQYNRSENNQRNKSLMAKLRSKGYGVTKARGGSKEGEMSVFENSFVVVDIKDSGRLKRDIIALGKEFEQDSVLFMPAGNKEGVLIGTGSSEDSFPGPGKTLRLGGALFGKDGEFFTSINGRPFILKMVESVDYPDGWFGRFGDYVAARTPWQQL